MNEFTHIDLFSGIGGFTLAAQWAGFRTIVFCEKDEFCQKVLQERFGGIVTNPKDGRRISSNETIQARGNTTKCSTKRIPIISEIRDFDGTRWQGATLLTGGFPCQPFSVAGRKRGKEDDRYLWPEMFRVIKEAKPRWILAENVAGIIPMALDTVLSDLEDAGYETGSVVVPACAINAPHRRDRIWIIAYDGIRQPMELSGGIKTCGDGIGESNQNATSHPIKPGTRGNSKQVNNENGRIGKDRQTGLRQENGQIGPSGISTANQDASDSEGKRYRRSADKKRTIQAGNVVSDEQKRREVWNQIERCTRNASDPEGGKSGEQKTGDGREDSSTANQDASDPEGGKSGEQKTGDGREDSSTANQDASDSSTSGLSESQKNGFREFVFHAQRGDWEIPWIEIATRFCRMDDGLPDWVYCDRVKRLKALGNAIVPQIAHEIMRGIREIEEKK